MACSFITMPSGLRQLTSMGTVTGNRLAFLRSTFVPSGLVPRLAMFAGFLPTSRIILNSPKQMDRSRESLGQKSQNSYCTKGQYRPNRENVKAFCLGRLRQTVSRLWKSHSPIFYCAGGAASCGGAAASTVTCAGIGRYPLRVRSLYFFNLGSFSLTVMARQPRFGFGCG